MKAQTFLEYFRENNHKNKNTISAIKDEVFDVADFYSQPFKPEMITELFEGFETNSLGITFICVSPYTIGILDGKRYMLHDNEPLTLHDFISDCNRAGIELEWKAEIAKEYFK